jgi:hypothetical protein
MEVIIKGGLRSYHAARRIKVAFHTEDEFVEWERKIFWIGDGTIRSLRVEDTIGPGTLRIFEMICMRNLR